MYIQAFRPRDILFSLPVFIIDRTALSGPHFIFAGMVFRSGLAASLFSWPAKATRSSRAHQAIQSLTGLILCKQ